MSERRRTLTPRSKGLLLDIVGTSGGASEVDENGEKKEMEDETKNSAKPSTIEARDEKSQETSLDQSDKGKEQKGQESGEEKEPEKIALKKEKDESSEKNEDANQTPFSTPLPRKKKTGSPRSLAEKAKSEHRESSHRHSRVKLVDGEPAPATASRRSSRRPKHRRHKSLIGDKEDETKGETDGDEHTSSHRSRKRSKKHRKKKRSPRDSNSEDTDDDESSDNETEKHSERLQSTNKRRKEKPLKERERSKKKEKVVALEDREYPPVVPITKKFSDMPPDVIKKIDRLKIDEELRDKYLKHLWTITRFLMKSSFPEKSPYCNPGIINPADRPQREKRRPQKKTEEEKAAAAAAEEERIRLNSKKKGFVRSTRARLRPYALPADMEFGQNIIEVPTKPFKKLYKTQELSGRGGFGSVFVGKDLSNKQRIAMKRLPHTTPRITENNYSEIAFLAQCQHPNICAFKHAYLLHEKDDKEKELVIVMEFLEGGTLSEAARAHRFSDQHIAYVAHEILEALKYLHSKHLVHRDLKSANVMMSIKGEIKLIDFGLCADFSEGPRTKMLGSPYWLPPEMSWELPHSYAADVWSMAVCIIELYLANPPYPNSSTLCMFMAATKGLTDQIPAKATDDARDFLSQCFTQNPYKRPTVETLLTHQWVTRDALGEGIIEVLKQVFLTNSLESLGF